MRERIAVHAFQRRPRHQGVLPRHIEQRGGFHHQERPQALAAAEARIAHGLEQPRRPSALAVDRGRCEQAIEQRFRVVGHLAEPVLEDRLDVHAFFHSIDAGHAFPPGTPTI